jgi:hypothetical protein
MVLPHVWVSGLVTDPALEVPAVRVASHPDSRSAGAAVEAEPLAVVDREPVRKGEADASGVDAPEHDDVPDLPHAARR